MKNIFLIHSLPLDILVIAAGVQDILQKRTKKKDTDELISFRSCSVDIYRVVFFGAPNKEFFNKIWILTQIFFCNLGLGNFWYFKHKFLKIKKIEKLASNDYKLLVRWIWLHFWKKQFWQQKYFLFSKKIKYSLFFPLHFS